MAQQLKIVDVVGSSFAHWFNMVNIQKFLLVTAITVPVDMAALPVELYI